MNLSADHMSIKKYNLICGVNKMNFFNQSFFQNLVFFVASVIAGIIITAISKRKSAINIERAKDELINFIEKNVVLKKEISATNINNLKSALERKYHIHLKYENISLMQDVLLKFQYSNHIDNEQKYKYLLFIEEIIKQLKDDKEYMVNNSASINFKIDFDFSTRYTIFFISFFIICGLLFTALSYTVLSTSTKLSDAAIKNILMELFKTYISVLIGVLLPYYSNKLIDKLFKKKDNKLTI